MRRDSRTWVAVRCCCQPARILGFVLLTEDDLRRRRARLPLRVTASVFDPRNLDPAPEAVVQTAQEVELRVMSTQYSTELAVYSEERPIEFWRTVAGFVEARQPATSYGRR